MKERGRRAVRGPRPRGRVLLPQWAAGHCQAAANASPRSLLQRGAGGTFCKHAVMAQLPTTPLLTSRHPCSALLSTLSPSRSLPFSPPLRWFQKLSKYLVFISNFFVAKYIVVESFVDPLLLHPQNTISISFNNSLSSFTSPKDLKPP